MLSNLTDEQLIEYHELFKRTIDGSKRLEGIKVNGYDTKDSYHLVRLLDECSQLLMEGDLDLQRNREQLKSIRRGEWSLEDVEEYFKKKESQLEEAYVRSTLPHGPDEEALRELLLNCLEIHYGSLDKILSRKRPASQLVREIEEVLTRYRDAAE